jgi:hypothetical protein
VWERVTVGRSGACPHLFGDRLADLETDAIRALATFSDDDTFNEQNEFLIHIGRRP